MLHIALCARRSVCDLLYREMDSAHIGSCHLNKYCPNSTTSRCDCVYWYTSLRFALLYSCWIRYIYIQRCFFDFFGLHCWRRMARLWKYAYWLLLPNFQDDWVGHNSKKQFSSSRNCTGTPGSFDLFLPGGQLTVELPRYLRYNPSTVTYIYTCPIYIDWDCWMDGRTDRQTHRHACMPFIHASILSSIHTYTTCMHEDGIYTVDG